MVKLGCVTVEGDELLLGLAGANELFGESLAGPEAYEAKTLCDCDLLCLSYAELEQHPSLAPALVKAISQRQRQSQLLLALMGLRRVEDRVKGFLELLGIDYGVSVPQGLRLTPRLTHQEIASALGTTRVTVTRIIGQLKELGWLSLDSQRSIILSPLPRR
jgi:CRP-like cAMP-binding protein